MDQSLSRAGFSSIKAALSDLGAGRLIVGLLRITKHSRPIAVKEARNMSAHSISLLLELPPEIVQQDAWDLEEQCKQVTGVTTELQEPKDVLAATLLFIHVIGPYLGQAAA